MKKCSVGLYLKSVGERKCVENCKKKGYGEWMNFSDLSAHEQSQLELRTGQANLQTICGFHKEAYLENFNQLFGTVCSNPCKLHAQPKKLSPNQRIALTVEHRASAPHLNLIPGRSICKTCFTEVFRGKRVPQAKVSKTPKLKKSGPKRKGWKGGSNWKSIMNLLCSKKKWYESDSEEAMDDYSDLEDSDYLPSAMPGAPQNADDVDSDPDDEDLGVAETYADYMPLKLKIGVKHPDPVVETASLSSVEPTDVWYNLSIPSLTISTGGLSALQLEAIVYASQQHEQFLPDGSRAGFLIGDGAGVGKGRTIAGAIYENYLNGRKRSIWVSVSSDLKYDAERDLRDIGAGKIPVYALNKFKYGDIASAANKNIKKGVIYSTYSALIGHSNRNGNLKTRLEQILKWCGPDFDGLIVFDECHRAKNLVPAAGTKPTKTGEAVLALQESLPKARVIYASATGASEPRNMAYMVRLGMWGKASPFAEFSDFIGSVEKRGVGAMEIVAMDMKLRGTYIARQLSFQGVTFRIEDVPLSDEEMKTYNDSVALWVEAMDMFSEACELIKAAKLPVMRMIWCQFWAAHQRFFKYLCIAFKVKRAVQLTREAVQEGKCVVIGLQSTGEARTLAQLEKDDGELTDFVSSAKGVLENLVEKNFPAPGASVATRRSSSSSSSSRKTRKSAAKVAKSKDSSSSGQKRKRESSLKASKKLKILGMSSDSDFKDSENDISDVDDENKSPNTRDRTVPLKTPKSDPGIKMSDDEGGASETDSDCPMSDDDDEDESSEVSEEGDADSDFKASDDEKSEGDSDAKDYSESEAEESDDEYITPSTWKKPKKEHTKSTSTPVPGKKAKTIQDQLDEILSKCQRKSNQDSAAVLRGIDKACKMKEALLEKIEKLGERLPPATLDELIDELGGPKNVAEMTGRKGRVVSTSDGKVQYESRAASDTPLETMNLAEKQLFMDGDKVIAIISEAASSGISLQSDKRVKNQKRRVHITLELPWSADRAIQQFGRTHRSNQVNAPEYIFMISNLAGERRFASIVAKRLESLGALTHADRRATETRDLSRYNIDNKYGTAALGHSMRIIMGLEPPTIRPPRDYTGDFFQDVRKAMTGVGLITRVEDEFGDYKLELEKGYHNISRFLNRILGLPVDLQNRVFKYFTDVLGLNIARAKKEGTYDLGILDLGAAGDDVKRVKQYNYLRKHATGQAVTELHTVHVQRGMSWDDAMAKWAELTGEEEGFYLPMATRCGKSPPILVIATDARYACLDKNYAMADDILVTIYKPHLAMQMRREPFGQIRDKYRKVTASQAERHWKDQYDWAEDNCTHAYGYGHCSARTLSGKCEIGLRRRTYHVLSGSVLCVWHKVEKVLKTQQNKQARMQVIRLKTSEGSKLVGAIIPNGSVDYLRIVLAEDAEKTTEQTF